VARRDKLRKKQTDLRPTSSKVRLALFNILYDVNGSKFLDLFAGTGEVGLDALKKGADKVIFVEKNKKRAFEIKKKVSKHFSNFKVYPEDSIKFLKSYGENFNIIFADPPYNYKDYNKLIDLALLKLEDNGIFILEHNSNNSFGADKVKKYGDTVLSFFYK